MLGYDQEEPVEAPKTIGSEEQFNASWRSTADKVDEMAHRIR